MAKSKGRHLADLISSSGTVSSDRFEEKTLTIAGNTVDLGGTLTLDTSDIGEDANYLYFTNDRADARIVAAGSTNWNTAYGWGNHASAGYLTTDSDTTYSAGTGVTLTGTTFSLTDTAAKWTQDNTKISNWDTAYGWGDHSTATYATQSYVGTAISNLVDSSPATLDTLNELAAALGDDPNFATTTATAIGLKAPIASPTFTGTATFNSTVTANSFLQTNSANYQHKFFLANGTTGVGYIYSTGSTFQLDTQAAQPMELLVNGAPRLTLGTTGSATFTPTTAGHAVFNEGGVDADFRVESSGNANMLFVDGGSNRVIVGAAGGLTSTFNVSGNAQFSNGTGDVGSLSIAPSNDRQLITANSPGNYGDYGVTLKSMRATGGSAYINNIDMTYQGTVLNEEGLDLDFRVESSGNANGLYLDGGGNFIAMGNNAKSLVSNYADQHGVGIDLQTGVVEISGDATPLALGRTTTAGAEGDLLVFRTESNVRGGISNTSANDLRISSTSSKLKLGGSADYVMIDTTASNARIELVDNSQANPPTIIGNGPNFIIENGGVERVFIDGSGNTVFNDTGVDADFRVESDANTHALFVDGGTNHVGMGTATLNRSGLGVDHIVLTVGADTEMGMLELQGTRTSDADLGRIAFLNAGTRRAEIVAARIDADNSTKLYFQTSNAGSLGTRLTIGKDGASTFNTDVTSGGQITSARGSDTGTYGFRHEGAGKYMRMGVANSSFAYFETDANAGFSFEGNVTVPDQILHAGDTDTYMQFHAVDEWRVVTGGTERIEITNTEVVINDSSVDMDFRVESDTNANMLLVNGGNNSVSIGTSTSEATFTVGGSATFNADSADADFRVESDNDAYALFVDGGNDRVVVGSAGTDHLNSKFVVVGRQTIANGSSTQGTILLTDGYAASTDDHILNIGTQRSSGGPYIGYGLGQFQDADGLWKSTYDNFSGSHSVLVLNGSTLEYNLDTSNSQITVGDTVTVQNGYKVGRSGAVFNDDGYSAFDFRVESDTNTHAFFLDAGNNVIGTGTASPATYVGTGGLAVKGDTVSDLSLVSGGIASGNNSHQMRYWNDTGTAYEIARTRVNVGAGQVNRGEYQFAVNNGGGLRQWLDVDYGGNVTFNEGGNDSDFRVESDTNTHMLFVDASANKVGVGLVPTNVFEVKSAGDGADQITLQHSGNTVDIVSLGQDGGHGSLVLRQNNGVVGVYLSATGGAIFNENSLDADFRVETNGTDYAFFIDGSTNNIGIQAGTEWAMVGGGNGTSSVGSSIDMGYDATIYGGSAYWAGGLDIGTNFWRDASGYHYKRTDRQATAYQQSSQGASHAFYSQTTGNAGAVISWNNLLYMDRTQTIFNDTGADTDFRVESDGNSHMLFVDAGNNRVGIGESAPGRPFEVPETLSAKIVNFHYLNTVSAYKISSGTATRNVRVEFGSGGEYWLKMYIVGLWPYGGEGYGTVTIEVAGFGGEERFTVIETTKTAGGSTVTATVSADNDALNIEISSTQGAWRWAAMTEMIFGPDAAYVTVDGTDG